MAANIAAKTLKYVYLRSQISYKAKWGVDLVNINVAESIPRSLNNFEVYIFKMSVNMAAKALNYVYLSP